MAPPVLVPGNAPAAGPTPVPTATQLLQGALDALNYCTEQGVTVDQQMVDDIVTAAANPSLVGQQPITLKSSLYSSISRMEDLRRQVHASRQASKGWELDRALSRLEELFLCKCFRSYASMAQSFFLLIAVCIAFVLYQAQEKAYVGQSLYTDVKNWQLGQPPASNGTHDDSADATSATPESEPNSMTEDKNAETTLQTKANMSLLREGWLEDCNRFPTSWVIPSFLMETKGSGEQPSEKKPAPANSGPPAATNEAPLSTNQPPINKEYQAPVAATPVDKQVEDNDTSLAVCNFIINLLTAYVCPCLGGILGSAIYVLRMINIRSLKHDLSDRCISTYMVRLFLGGIFGTVITWFIGTGTPDAWKNLPPLALSFISGYNIELVFTAMDKLISAFTASNPVTLQENHPRG